jgi:hypothetical protein
MLGRSSVAAQPAASREGHSSMELVTNISENILFVNEPTTDHSSAIFCGYFCIIYLLFLMDYLNRNHLMTSSPFNSFHLFNFSGRNGQSFYLSTRGFIQLHTPKSQLNRV